MPKRNNWTKYCKDLISPQGSRTIVSRNSKMTKRLRSNRMRMTSRRPIRRISVLKKLKNIKKKRKTIRFRKRERRRLENKKPKSRLRSWKESRPIRRKIEREINLIKPKNKNRIKREINLIKPKNKIRIKREINNIIKTINHTKIKSSIKPSNPPNRTHSKKTKAKKRSPSTTIKILNQITTLKKRKTIRIQSPSSTSTNKSRMARLTLTANPTIQNLKADEPCV